MDLLLVPICPQTSSRLRLLQDQKLVPSSKLRNQLLVISRNSFPRFAVRCWPSFSMATNSSGVGSGKRFTILFVPQQYFPVLCAIHATTSDYIAVE